MTIDPRQIELNETQKRQLAQLAERTGRPWAEILSEALRVCFPSQGNGATGFGDETLFDGLSRDGLVGCIQGGPTDMSTNQKFMEGFGQDDRRTGSD